MHLKVLAAVARHSSVTEAAKQLHYSQPSVSHHLSRLEAATGVKLVQRIGRGIRLTPEGQLLANRAAEIVGRVDAATNELAAQGGRCPMCWWRRRTPRCRPTSSRARSPGSLTGTKGRPVIRRPLAPMAGERLGNLSGSWQKAHAAHIGAIARQRARERRMREELAGIEDVLSGLQARRNAIDARRAVRKRLDTLSQRESAVATALHALIAIAAEHGVPTDRARQAAEAATQRATRSAAIATQRKGEAAGTTGSPRRWRPWRAPSGSTTERCSPSCRRSAPGGPTSPRTSR